MKKILLKYKNDIILALSIIFVCLIAFLIFSLTMKAGEYVVVTVDGEQVCKFSLQEDTETIILGANSSQDQNALVIKNGKAYIESATCPDKICVSHRKISKTGEMIVCLPNKVVVSVVEE